MPAALLRRESREDPMSHRIIEKRRRDRMNNCLHDLSRLIPAEYLKKGRGRVEKTEIIEMAIKHMQFLQSRANLAAGLDCSPGMSPGDLRVAKCEQSPGSEREASSLPETVCTPPPADSSLGPVVRPIVTEHYRLGYQECLSEARHFLVEVEGFFATDPLCAKLINHLQKHCDKIMKGDRLNFPRTRQPGETTSSSGSNSSYGNGNGSGSASSGISSGPKTSASNLGTGSEESPPPPGVAGSQLRDILCASPAPHHQYYQEGPPSAEMHDVHHDAHLPYAESSGSVRHLERLERLQEPLDQHQDPHQHHHSYKFKNTIKQRFNSEEHNGLKRRRTTRSPSPPSSCSQQSSLPIFVLHTKGAFYIPLTVAYEVLAPYLDADFLSDAASSRSVPTAVGVGSSPAPGVVLHPVTISVNFQQYLKPPHHHHPPPPAPSIGPPQSTPLPWSRSESGSMASFLPLPWEVCAAGSAR